VKEWICVQVTHHKGIGAVISEYQKEGWQLFAYQAAGSSTAVNHYLLFEREASTS
jgi:hypothetical protein